MFTNQFPYFKRGNILKQEILENLRDYPREFLDLYFQDYSEGIISGVNLIVGNNTIEIEPGIIKFAGRIYLLADTVELDYEDENQELMIKVEFLEPEETGNFRVCGSEVRLAEEIELADNELELGRFKLRRGANLRDDYDNFADFATEYNTVNIINVKYSYLKQPTLHPSITDAFAQRLWEQSEVEQLDLMFAATCLNSRAVGRALIVNYLEKKIKVDQEEYTNRELYDYLKRVIAGLGPVDNSPDKGPEKIIVN